MDTQNNSAKIKELLDNCDYILLCFSGGKDSLCCLLDLYERGYGSKIQLHHHLVDGHHSEPVFFDWAITKNYCSAIANFFQIPIFYSWREGGFRKEMLRDQTRTAAVWFEQPDGSLGTAGGIKGPLGYRRRFPMPTGNLSIRWCSPSLKISVMDALIANQKSPDGKSKMFDGKKTVIVTGERRQEAKSPNTGRALYKEIEPHRTSCKKREVWAYRPVIDWKKEEVWAKIQEHGIQCHPAYELGFGRASCRSCVFLRQDDWATLNKIDPEIIKEITDYEKEFGVTMGYEKQRAKKGLPQLNVQERSLLGTARDVDPFWVNVANSRDWNLPVWLPPKKWKMPSGAYASTEGGS